MRALAVIALSALLAIPAQAEDQQPAQPAPQGGVTVNMGALPTAQPKIPMPRHKPSADEMRALLVPMPRHKPDPASLAATEPAAPADATAAATPTPAPAPAASATGQAPMPRPKPDTKLALAGKSPKQPKAPVIGTEASPAPPAPMTSPQGAADIASALRGSSIAPPTIDPTAGFAVLTQVRFRSGRTELGDDAKTALDALAARLLSKTEERVRLAAFSGAPGDMSSDSRRLSLERGLAVRSYLVSKGVPASRVDVLSFGGATHGASDRVDVLVRST
jgi:outer membrane protein OmpA-like peptidoglycan-associated protein